MSAVGDFYRKIISKILSFGVATIGKTVAKMVLSTCKWEVEGLERFGQYAAKKKCILMLWHNRLAIASFILYRYARHFTYAAFVSNSRDGELIASLVRSYKVGSTIKVPHNSRHEALRLLIRHMQEKQDVIIITPDGPRGPLYEVKPGIALAALSTGAFVFPFSWQADKYWELKTWDKLRLPKPFSTIKVVFEAPVNLDAAEKSIEKARVILQAALPTD